MNLNPVVLSGFVGATWIGCAMKQDELESTFASMKEDAPAVSGSLRVRAATADEVRRFNGEAGTDFPIPQAASAYSIHMSEEQRIALLDVLKKANVGGPEEKIGDVEYPLFLWQSMLEELPKIESECPGCLHGFCL